MREYKSSLFNIEIPIKDGYLIYNTSSGAVIKLNKTIKEYIEKEDISLLYKQGFVVNNSIDEINKIIYEHNKNIYRTICKNLHIEIAPTFKCQAKCWYCFESCDDKYNKVMDMETAEKVVEFIKKRVELYSAEKLSVLFFGGEPLLAYDIMIYIGDNIKSYCASRGMEYESRIVTNGILLDKVKANELKEHINLKRVQVTLDGMKENYNKVKGIDCFDRVINNIKDNNEIVDITVRLNVSSENKDEIEQLIDYLLKDLKLDGKIKMYLAKVDMMEENDNSDDRYICVDSYSRFKDQLLYNVIKKYSIIDKKKLLPPVRRTYCGFEQISQVLIGPSGELYKCQRQIGRDEFIVGNIDTGENYGTYEMSFYDGIPEGCKKGCVLLPVCYGGCPIERKKMMSEDECKQKVENIKANIMRYYYSLQQ